MMMVVMVVLVVMVMVILDQVECPTGLTSDDTLYKLAAVMVKATQGG